MFAGLDARCVAGFVLLAGLAVTVRAQVPVDLAIDEAHASAVLSGEDLRLRLPLTQSAPAETVVGVKLLSPKNEQFIPMQQEVRVGAASVEFPVPQLEKIAKGSAGTIAWYRIAWSVEIAGKEASHGILSLGAITRNLISLSLASSSNDLVPGKPLGVRVFAGNPVTRAPVPGVKIQATMELDLDTSQKRRLVRDGVTDRAGELKLEYAIPEVEGISGTLKVKGTLSGISGAAATAELTQDFDDSTRGTIHVQKDKPLYQPGQVVHLRALVLDARGRAAAKTPVVLDISDADDKKVLQKELTTNRFGIAAWDWKLSEQIETGRYSADFSIGADSSLDAATRENIPVERYDLPEFTVKAVLDRGYYLEGQTPEVKIHAEYLFGKPVTSGSVRLVRETERVWNPKTHRRESQESAELKATLDGEGDAVFHPDLTGEFQEFRGRGYERFTDLTWRAYVTDATSGRTEPRKFTMRLSHQAIHIYLSELARRPERGRISGLDFLCGRRSSHVQGCGGEDGAWSCAVEDGRGRNESLWVG